MQSTVQVLSNRQKPTAAPYLTKTVDAAFSVSSAISKQQNSGGYMFLTTATRATYIWKSLLAVALTFMLHVGRTEETVVLADSLRPGDIISGAIRYGRRVITLPVGKWRLVSSLERDASTTNSGATMLNASFDEIVDGRLNRLLSISATKYSRNLNWIDEPCKRQGDSYWIEDRKRSFNDQFCIRVGFESGVVDGARGESFQIWARNIITTGIKYSPDMPFTSVTQYTAYDYLMMRISFNPDIYAIPRSKRAERQFNDWNSKALAQQPERVKFYEALKNWAPGYATAVSRAFVGDLTLMSKDFGEPIFPQKQ